MLNPHPVYIANDIAYVVARSGDTFKELGDEFGISWKKLVKYNDLQRDYTLTQGDIIYLKAKEEERLPSSITCIYSEGWRLDAYHFAEIRYPTEESL